MKQILQNLKTGATELAEVPCPPVRAGHVLIRTRASLVSAGTERMLVEFSEAGLIGKARRQPEKVRQVLDKIRADGLLPTLEAVFARLDQPMPLGYCNAGTVCEVGPGVGDLRPGDRVASNGPHAEFVCVPRNLCARVPDRVADEQAAFAVAGAIALQGVRLAAPTIGENVAVLGLGLVGLLAVQILRAGGCRVFGTDFAADRIELARRFGAEVADLSGEADPVEAARAFSGGRGMDAVLIAAATNSDRPVHQAAQMSRQRGRVVLVGVTGLKLNRADFYEKELSFQVSCSYGPGRYDPSYEQGGQDYPYGFVRWTERRNIEAALALMAEGKLDVGPLISERVPFEQAGSAYKRLTTGSAIGTVFTYAEAEPERAATVTVGPPPVRRRRAGAGAAVVGAIGAGNFARSVQFPLLMRAGARLRCVADLDPLAVRHAADKFGFETAATDYRQVLEDPAVNAVFVTVPHSLHAPIASEALEAGKCVYVEKPLAIDLAGLRRVREAVAHASGFLSAGFNRRFSPHARRMAELLSGRAGPLCITMTVNAGAVPAAHWIQDPAVGGGRIIGEGCHFVDTMRFLVGAPIGRVRAASIAGSPDGVDEDKAALVLDFADGSLGVVNYFASGHKAYAKERLEAFCDGKVLNLDNFRRLRGYGWRRFRRMTLRRQDKGHRAAVEAFLQAVAEGVEPPIAYDEIEEVTLATFAAVRSMREGGRTVPLGELRSELEAPPAGELHGPG